MKKLAFLSYRLNINIRRKPYERYTEIPEKGKNFHLEEGLCKSYNLEFTSSEICTHRDEDSLNFS